MKRVFLFTLLYLIGHRIAAQENRLHPYQPNSAEIFHKIERLGFLGSVLYLAAHPDDENTRLISYLSNERNARTAYLSLTRGSGGQNLIGAELREGLGVIRTQELLEARNIDGGEQYFTRANDFGYSKHPVEALNIWEQSKVQDDVIKIIREFKPDIIINRFDHRTPGTTHGHHTASAMLGISSFIKAASDYKLPNLQSEPWKTERIFFNTSWWFYGSQEKFEAQDPSQFYRIETGRFYPWIGKSNGEIAALSRSKHKSQGFGSSGSREKQVEYLELINGSAPSDNEDIFSGIDTSWSRVEGGAHIQDLLTNILSRYDYNYPEGVLTALIDLHKAINELNDNPYKEYKLAELEEIILDVLGFYGNATVPNQQVSVGSNVPVVIELSNRSCMDIQTNISSACIKISDQAPFLDLKSTNYIKGTLTVPENHSPTSPYYLQEKSNKGMYRVDEPTLIGEPETNQNDLDIFVELKLDSDLSINVTLPVHYKTTDPVRGEIHEPLHITPALSVSIKKPVYIITDSNTPKIEVTVRAYEDTTDATLELCTPEEWIVKPRMVALPPMNKGQVITKAFTIEIPNGSLSEGFISGLVKTKDKTFDKEVVKIEYEHIPDQQILTSNEAKVIKPELINKAKRVAYITGAGDSVGSAIESMGSTVDRFLPSEIPNDLAMYDALVIGIRAYNVYTTELTSVNSRLNEYVKQGGTLIIQYQTSRGMKNVQMGPYPITLSRKRITQEESKVKFIQQNHKLLHMPNKISQDDFDHWVQERGLYFPSTWDSNYVALLEMEEFGEDPATGSLLVAKYGNGHVIYTGLSLFRQLPAGVPGAYRLLANMLSIGKE